MNRPLNWLTAIGCCLQLAYAAADVLYLHALRDKLTEKLTRTGRLELAQKVFAFLPTRAQLDLAGWPEIDIFAHH